MPMNNYTPGNRDNTGKFKKGSSGNPFGRPKLPSEIKEMKDVSLQKAIQILHDKINDEKYIKALAPNDLLRILEVAFDRFGLPKASKNEIVGAEKCTYILKWADEPIDYNSPQLKS